MIDIRIDHHQAVLEIEVFDQYDAEDIPKVVDAYLEMVRRHHEYAVLEVVHKGWGNWLTFLSRVSEYAEKAEIDPNELSKITERLKKYAIVTDRRQLARFYAFLLSMAGAKAKVFAFHEKFNAQLWLAGQLMVDG